MQDKQVASCPRSDSHFSHINLIPMFTTNATMSPITTPSFQTTPLLTITNISQKNVQLDKGKQKQPQVEARKARQTKLIMIGIASSSSTREPNTPKRSSKLTPMDNELNI